MVQYGTYGSTRHRNILFCLLLCILMSNCVFRYEYLSSKRRKHFNMWSFIKVFWKIMKLPVVKEQLSVSPRGFQTFLILCDFCRVAEFGSPYALVNAILTELQYNFQDTLRLDSRMCEFSKQ